MLQTMAFAITKNDVGQRVYSQACATCHAANVSKGIGAPTAFDAKAWKQRLTDAEKHSGPGTRYKDAHAYLLHQINIGRGLMPHHGLCLESKLPKIDCSDSAYLAAIKYMSEAQPAKPKK